ncbi:stAR-related lipid transfer protein 7, mitochondrial [Strongylocentrotus purpuratus]|uniref:StAR-related lipid transfer protein 7, mitochondrial n=1 Tax=Strongylocentrotus purpuratus TaxID=7668 RepID=A0A7M7RFS3_STRPU|nr:stAR-related lipid transfer protein 7, mitochondrial [Strongylocentrotus purpuratus]
MAVFQALSRTRTLFSVKPVTSTSCNAAKNLIRLREYHWRGRWRSSSFSENVTDSVLGSINLGRKLLIAMRLTSGQTFSEHVSTIFSLLTRQCNVYAAQRLRRLEQMMCLYRSIYSERSLQSLAVGFARRYLKGKRRNYVIFGGALFAWDQEKITNRQINGCLDDVDLIRILRSDPNPDLPQLSSWEKVMAKSEMMVWRRKMDHDYLYEYKVFGTFTDCTAKSFFKVQTDLDYRNVWDKHVIETGVIDQDKETGTEIVYWATQFPFPMNSRDYLYARRTQIFHRHRVMVIYSKATNHPRKPETKRYVRVTRFSSKMVIKPFTSFDENGFDYMLTYHDDPKAPIPSSAVNWMATTGVPDFMHRVHNAALALDAMPGSNFKDMQSEKQYTTNDSSCYS